jgi:hypothetical protein
MVVGTKISQVSSDSYFFQIVKKYRSCVVVCREASEGAFLRHSVLTLTQIKRHKSISVRV